MSLRYAYPGYQLDLTPETLDRCCDMGARIASEVGLVVRHQEFLDRIRGKPGVRIAGERVHFDLALLQANIAKHRARLNEQFQKRTEPPKDGKWTMACAGVSMSLLDIETEEVRMATCDDLRDSIKLLDSFGIGGNYPVMPQDLPPLMRAIACFKICWESSPNVRPFDYLDRRQTPFLYEMHQAMGKPFDLTLCVAQPMMLDEKDVQIFLDFYPKWKEDPKNVRHCVLDYPMLGLTKPVTFTGSIVTYVADLFSVFTLFNTFDPELEIPVGVQGGLMTDLRHACWAWGHPRQHLMYFLNSRITPSVAGMSQDWYRHGGALLETSSSAIDEQAAIEKMGVAMVAALLGARHFYYVGSLCVDDLFSGVQFVIDVEMVNYIRETIEAFDPHPDILSMDDDLYETIRDVCLGKDEFISSADTVRKFRNIMPSSDRLVREKLQSWMQHRKTLKDRAKEECVERIRTFKQEFHLSGDQQKALDEIYAEAETSLGR